MLRKTCLLDQLVVSIRQTCFVLDNFFQFVDSRFPQSLPTAACIFGEDNSPPRTASNNNTAKQAKHIYLLLELVWLNFLVFKIKILINIINIVNFSH